MDFSKQHSDGTIFKYKINRTDDGVEISGILNDNKKEVIIPDYIDGRPVVSILPKAFAKREIEKITFPNTLKTICYNAFVNCTQLKELNFPKSLQRIQGYAFYGCSSLTSIDLPKTTSYETGVFADCSGLQVAKINSGICIPKETFLNCPLKQLYLPSTIKTIYSSSLEGVPKTMKIYCQDNPYVEKYAHENGYRINPYSEINSFLSEISNDTYTNEKQEDKDGISI